jgi:hypothetical protein
MIESRTSKYRETKGLEYNGYGSFDHKIYR